MKLLDVWVDCAAVKTSNHIRESKRFLRVPLLHLLNFYNLVDCQTLGSTSGFHAIAAAGSRKTEGEMENGTAGWIIPLCFYEPSARRNGDSLCTVCVAHDCTTADSHVYHVTTYGTHTQPGLHPSYVNDRPAFSLVVTFWRCWRGGRVRTHTLPQNKGAIVHHHCDSSDDTAAC